MTARGDLEHELADLFAHLDAPSGETLAAGVRGRLRASASTATGDHRIRSRRWRRALVAIAGAAIAALGAAQVSPAVADLLGLRGLRVVRSEDRPLISRDRAATGPLGVEVPLGEARRIAGFDLRRVRSAEAGRPTAYVDRGGPGGVPLVALVYRRVTLTQFEGRFEAPALEKLVRVGEIVEPVTVAGRPGLWVGGDHVLAYLDDQGRPVEARRRTSGPVLVWEDGGVTLRLEGAAGKDEALRLAATVA